ncbi:MAG: isoprenylcysteine carboxylmethyltransferase family protein, partial [Candidatus Limnocylindria bacterium]|nr:isoprenylcysteine carboxylmethyltransferase family protein [Candidatus Limnocylindria bacterium]
MDEGSHRDLVAAFRAFVDHSPRQSFVLFPLGVLAERALRGKLRDLDLRFVPLLAAGYGLYRWGGLHREANRAGTPGFKRMPERLLTDGPYAFTRNPMYLGHLPFLAGLALVTRSPAALAALLWQRARLRGRVAEDESRLATRFGDAYRRYTESVPRWLP